MVFLLCGCTDNHITNFGDDFGAFIQKAWNDMQAPPLITAFPQNGPMCVFRRAVTSGLNKICYYTCTGSAEVGNQAAATEICPLRYKDDRARPDQNSGFHGGPRYAAITATRDRAQFATAE
jgi:hypothetical protein